MWMIPDSTSISSFLTTLQEAAMITGVIQPLSVC